MFDSATNVLVRFSVTLHYFIIQFYFSIFFLLFFIGFNLGTAGDLSESYGFILCDNIVALAFFKLHISDTDRNMKV